MWLGSSYVVYAFLGNEVLGQASIFSTPSSPGKRGVLGQASIFSTPSSPGKRGGIRAGIYFLYTVIPGKAWGIRTGIYFLLHRHPRESGDPSGGQ